MIDCLSSTNLGFPVPRPMVYARALKPRIGLAVFSTCLLFFDGVTRADAFDQNNPSIVQALDDYEACMESAVSKAATMKTAMLRQKVFNGKSKGCYRKLVAEVGIAREKETQKALRADQQQSEAKMAEITNNLIIDAKRDLGL